MTDTNALRTKLFIGLLILILLIAFINKKIKDQPAEKIEGKGIIFYNVIGLTGLTSIIILILATFFD